MFKALNGILSGGSRLTPVDIASVCNLICMMQEHAMYCVVHAAHGIAPVPGTKSSLPFKTLGSLVKVTVLGAHKKAEYRPSTELFAGLPKETRDLLVNVMTVWTAKYTSVSTSRIMYNQMAFWISATRVLRNISEHQSLSFVEWSSLLDDTDTLVVKVPTNPTGWLMSANPPDFFDAPLPGWALPVEWTGPIISPERTFECIGRCGVADVPRNEFVANLLPVARDLHMGLCKIIDSLRMM